MTWGPEGLHETRALGDTSGCGVVWCLGQDNILSIIGVSRSIEQQSVICQLMYWSHDCIWGAILCLTSVFVVNLWTWRWNILYPGVDCCGGSPGDPPGSPPYDLACSTGCSHCPLAVEVSRYTSSAPLPLHFLHLWSSLKEFFSRNSIYIIIRLLWRFKSLSLHSWPIKHILP